MRTREFKVPKVIRFAFFQTRTTLGTSFRSDCSAKEFPDVAEHRTRCLAMLAGMAAQQSRKADCNKAWSCGVVESTQLGKARVVASVKCRR